MRIARKTAKLFTCLGGSSQLGHTIVLFSLRNRFCGSLQCNGGSIIFDNVDYTGSLTPYVRNRNNHECRSFTSLATADEVSPGLTMDGTKCAVRMVSYLLKGNLI